MFSHEVQNCIQGAHTKIFVSGNGDALRFRYFCLQVNMASRLAHFPVVPRPAKRLHKVPPAKVARSFHPMDSTSSRTNCNRIERGFGASKKYPSTASLTISFNSSQVSPCVTMLSVRHCAT